MVKKKRECQAGEVKKNGSQKERKKIGEGGGGGGGRGRTLRKQTNTKRETGNR